MTNTESKKWDERYRADEFAYGTDPNEFLKEQLHKLDSGSILFGAEGEGRNSVYAAILGWDVSAFDISIEGKNKALKLAKKHNVTLDYNIGLLPELTFKNKYFDAVALIYAHFPPSIRSNYHQLLQQKLNKGGYIILEAFSKNHLSYREKNPKVGGPANVEVLLSIEEIKTDFNNLDIILLEEKEVELNEGLYHNGTGSVIRFVGQLK